MRLFASAACGLAMIAACGTYGASDDDTAPTADGGATDGTPNDGTTSPNDAASENAADGGGSTIRVLATNQTGAYAIAANEANVYWSDADLGEIRTVPLNGTGAIGALGTYGGSPTNLSVTMDGTVTWGDQGAPDKTGLHRVTSGGMSTVLFANPVGAFASFSDGTAAVVTTLNSNLTVVDTGSGVVLASYGPYGAPIDVIRDGTTTVWTASADSQLWKLESGVASQLVSGEADCRQLAANADGIYWTRPTDGWIRRLDRASGKSTIADQQQEAFGIAADASGVYWLTTDGAVRRWTQAGGVVTLATGQPMTIDMGSRVRAHALATTSKYVVWLTGEDVRRVEK